MFGTLWETARSRAASTISLAAYSTTSTVLKASGGGNPFAEPNQTLKLIIRGRKNALFFKTPAGAAIADVITCVIATAYHAGINAFDYLVKRQPELWLPWNDQATLEVHKRTA